MSQQLSGSDLAKALTVSKGRISQLLADGRLEGCYAGVGRDRRYDLGKVAAALDRRLDQGQMMGNGAGTRIALRGVQALIDLDEDAEPIATPAPKPIRADSELPVGDAARYELARTQKAEEEARKLRRQNSEAEGQYILASEVGRQVGRLVAQEVAEFETVIRDGCRRAADKMGLDFKVLRQILIEEWRNHRTRRANHLTAQSGEVAMTEAEQAADI